MNIATVRSAVLDGLRPRPAEVRVDRRSTTGPCRLDISGLGMRSAAETVRVQSGLRQSGITLPTGTFLVVVTPATERNTGLRDLPVALDVLTAAARIDPARLTGTLAVGSIDRRGTLASVRGMFPIAGLCGQLARRLIGPAAQQAEVAWAGPVEGRQSWAGAETAGTDPRLPGRQAGARSRRRRRPPAAGRESPPRPDRAAGPAGGPMGGATPSRPVENAHDRTLDTRTPRPRRCRHTRATLSRAPLHGEPHQHRRKCQRWQRRQKRRHRRTSLTRRGNARSWRDPLPRTARRIPRGHGRTATRRIADQDNRGPDRNDARRHVACRQRAHRRRGHHDGAGHPPAAEPTAARELPDRGSPCPTTATRPGKTRKRPAKMKATAACGSRRHATRNSTATAERARTRRPSGTHCSPKDGPHPKRWCALSRWTRPAGHGGQPTSCVSRAPSPTCGETRKRAPRICGQPNRWPTTRPDGPPRRVEHRRGNADATDGGTGHDTMARGEPAPNNRAASVRSWPTSRHPSVWNRLGSSAAARLRPRRYGMTGSQSYSRRARARDKVAEAAYDSRVDTERGVRAADDRSRS